jgi:penicillin-binding protein-related factor A (putative recombinase)
MAKLKEKDVTKQIRGVLRTLGIFHWKNWSGPMTYPKGIADILGIYNGKFLAIEVKREGWEPPEPTNLQAYKHFKEQQDFLISIRDNGGYAFFAQSVEDVIERLGLQDKVTPLFSRKINFKAKNKELDAIKLKTNISARC